MKHKRLFTIGILFLIVCVTAFSTACGNNSNVKEDNPTEFYDTVKESADLLEIVADEIYSYWYDAIYNEKYSGNINLAIAYAQADNSENIEKIKSNDKKIKDLYAKAKDCDCSDEVKEVMHAYNDFYSFVIDVSGSFNSYSAGNETKKKALSTALKNLSFEL